MKEHAFHGVIGVVAPAAGVGFSLTATGVEIGLRILAILAGIAVSLVAAWAIKRNTQEKSRLHALQIEREEVELRRVKQQQHQ